MRVVNDFADRAGKKPMVAFNITDEVDAMLRHHDAVAAAGGTCVMVSLNSIGLPGSPICGAIASCPSTATATVGAYFAPSLSRDRIRRLFKALAPRRGRPPAHERPPQQVLRAGRLGDRLGAAPAWLRCFTARGSCPCSRPASGPARLRTPTSGPAVADLIYVCGGGIMAHRGAIAAGVISIRQAWDARRQGIAAADFARTHPALAAALAALGR